MAVTNNGGKKKPGRNEQITLRFDLELNSPTQDSFSEFSYIQLARERNKKVPSEATGAAGLDQAPSASDHLASIAKRLEEKYGTSKLSKKRKRIVNDSDYIDRGYGYDLDDPFVDDSEFYEDFVPDNIDTKFGGFYINTGELQFKTAEDIDDIDFVVKKPAIKKQPSHQTPQAILASQKLKKAKQHAALHKGPGGKKKLFLSSAGHVPIKTQPPKLPHKKLNSKVIKHAPSMPSVPISIGDKSVTVPIFPTAKVDVTLSSENTSAVPGHDKTDDPAIDKTPPVLPCNLPLAVQNVVIKLTTKLTTDQQEGKVTNKQREVYPDILLEVENACKTLPIKIRNGVFEYLAHQLGVAKGTLTKRMKQLAKKKEDDALNDLILKLKNAVEQSMPKQIALYNEEVNKARSDSVSLSLGKSMEVDEDTQTRDVFDGSSLLQESQPDKVPAAQILSSQPTSEQVEGAGTKQKRLPRKKYHWSENDEVKKLLFEVVRVKVHIEEKFCRLNKDKGEDVINQFLEDKIKPLWPKGWMQRSVLCKITEPVHKKFSSQLPKKFVPIIKKEKQPTVLAKKQQVSSPQLTKKVPKSQSGSSTAISTVPITVSPRLMDVVQNMLTTSHNLITSGASQPIKSVVRLPSTSTSTPVTKTSVFSTPVINTKSLGGLSQKTENKQPAFSPIGTLHVGQTTAGASPLPRTSNHATIASSTSHRLISSKQSSVVLTTPILSIAKFTQGFPSSAKPGSTFVSPLSTGISNSIPLSYSKVNVITSFPTSQPNSPFSTNITQVPKTLTASNSSLISAGVNINLKPLPSQPQVSFPGEASYSKYKNEFVDINQPEVSRNQPAKISPQISLYPRLSQSETVLCSPKVKPNLTLPHVEHRQSDILPVGGLVRSPVEQIFEEHSYLKTGTPSIPSNCTSSNKQN